MLAQANKAFDDHAELSRQLVKKHMSNQEWTEFLDLMCPLLNPKDADFTDLRQQRLIETRGMIQGEYTHPNQMLPGIEFTAWSAYNAITSHIDHLPRRGASMAKKAETRFNVCLSGPGRDMKKRAFDIACRFAGLVNAG